MAKNKNQELTLEQKIAIEQEKERQAHALESYMKTGHGRPKTRREFLASGVIGMAGFVAAPSILELVLRSTPAHAQAASCPAGGSGLIPYINVNLEGGAGLAGNYLPTDLQGNPLATYSKMGVGKMPNFKIATEFNNAPFSANNDNSLISGFLDGLRTKTSQATRDKTAFVAVCVRSQDDSPDNSFNIAGLVQLAGLKGSDLPNLGTQATITGVRQKPTFNKLPSAPLKVSSFNDIQGALKLDGALATLTPTQQSSLLTLVKNLTSSQKSAIATSSSGATLANLAECATGKNIDLAGGSGVGVDPRQEAALQTIWNINTGSAANQIIAPTLVYNALNGKAGAVGISMGGYDYHGNSIATTRARDFDAGSTVGMALESAAALGKPCFIHVTSDGSVSATASDMPGNPWVGDNGSAGMSFILAFNPGGRPATSGFQIGGFNAAQAADETFMSSWNVDKASLGVFANYLQLNKKLNILDGIAPSQFSTAELNKVVKFG